MIAKKGSSNNYYLNFTIPFGYFNLSYNTNSRYSYSQIITGVNDFYKYSGVSQNKMLGLSYLFYRNQSQKSSLFLNFFRRNSKNYIEEFELQNQKRVSTGYEIGFKNQLNFINSQLNTKLTYRRGAGMLNALPASE